MLDIREIFLRGTIPVIINSFNQLTYLKGMITKLRANGFESIVIVDHASTYPPLLNYLINLRAERQITVIALPENKGPHWFFEHGIFKFMPSPIIFSDPDIDIPDKIDDLFCLKLLQATEKYQRPKAGCALDISQPEKFKPIQHESFGKMYRICEWERKYWCNKLEDNIYDADIDTTFHMFNKQYFNGKNFFSAVRISGDGFLARHLPWYASEIPPKSECEFYRQTTKFSTWL